MKNLTETQTDILIRSTALSNVFKRKLEAKARYLENEARKLIKANSAYENYHEASYLAEQQAIKFGAFAKKYHRLLSDNKSFEKGQLVDILADFEWPDTIDGLAKDSDLLPIMIDAVYTHPALGDVNIFDLIVDQAFEADQLKAVAPPEV